MKPNIELMKKLQRRFQRMKHHEHFQMDVIAVKTDCGSQMCIAGHTLDLAGYTRKALPVDERSPVLDYQYFSPSGSRVVNVLPTAARELGIGKYDAVSGNIAYGLFHDWALTTPRDAAERIGELIEEYS